MESRLARLLRSVPEWVEQSPHPIGIRDNDSVVVYVNPAAAALYGFARERLVGEQLTDYLDEAHQERASQEWRSRARGESEPYVLKFRMPGREEPFYHLIMPQPIRAVDGEILGSIAVVVAIPKPASLAGALAADWGVAEGARELLSRVGELVRRRSEITFETLRLTDPACALLSKREWDVLELMHHGARVRNVAQRLALSQNTVRSHLKSIFRKLGVTSQAELVDWVDAALARAAELVAPEGPGDPS